MKRFKAGLRKLAERYPRALNPWWKHYYRYTRKLETDAGRFHGDRKLVFERIHNENFWGSTESVSGSGSSLNYTRVLRKKLPRLLRALDVKTLLDAPCGDFNWMRHVALDGVKYIGGDLVTDLIQGLSKEFSSPSRQFLVLDIVDGSIPKADLWMCRDVLFHLSNEECMQVLRQFVKSEIQYFLTTTFDIGLENIDIKPGGFRHINLRLPPFNLPRPLYSIDDFVAPFPPRTLGCWSRDQVRTAISFGSS